jgi:hypothetical protein
MSVPKDFAASIVPGINNVAVIISATTVKGAWGCAIEFHVTAKVLDQYICSLFKTLFCAKF